MFSFYIPEKKIETLWFSGILVDIKRDHWSETKQEYKNYTSNNVNMKQFLKSEKSET